METGRLRNIVVCGAVGLCLAAVEVEASALCDGTAGSAAVQFHYGIYDNADIDSGGLSNEDSLFSHFDVGTEQWGLRHQYRAFEFEEFASSGLQEDVLQTNGDVHQLSGRWQWRQETARSGWSVALAPLLSVSSNLLKEPGEIGSDAWQVHAYGEYQQALNQQWRFLLGGCVDDRFGRYRFYPSGGVIWQPRPELRLRLAFPDSRVDLDLTPRWRLYLSASPNGGIWQVHNEELDNLSRFRYRSLRLTAGALWELHPQWQIGLEWGADLQRKFYFRRTDGSAGRAAADSAQFAALRLVWRW